MGYRKIPNLARNQNVLLFKEVYAMEKIHGTSASVTYTHSYGPTPQVTYFSGGAKHENFFSIFDHEKLLDRFAELGCGDENVTVFGEACGGKVQAMSHTYGKELRFIAFEVKIGKAWLSVPDAEDVVAKLGLEFVPYKRVPATVEALNAERDRPSRVAIRRGIEEEKMSEGIVIRPLIEMRDNRGERILAKHKRPEFSERKSKKDTVVRSLEELEVLSRAHDIADEWVTPMRLEHVLDKLDAPLDMSSVPKLIPAMISDIFVEGAGEIVESKEARRAIGKRTVKIFSEKLSNMLTDNQE